MTLQFEDIPVAKIHAHPNNVRTELGDLQELIESVKAKGILQALTVTPHPSVKGAYLLIAGHRRLAAARLAKLRSVPCIVNPDLNTETEQLEAMLVENLQRLDISPMEEARAYQHLLDLPDYDVARLAKSTGRSQRLVKERVKLGRLDAVQARHLHEGSLTIERALVLVDFADDERTVEQLERIPARDHSTWEVEVKRLQRAREWKAGLPKLRQELEAAGVELVDAPEGAHYYWSEYAAVYTPEDTFEKSAAEGHSAIVDEQTRHPYLNTFEGIIWVEKRGRGSAYVPPQPSPEEIADLQRREDIDAALGIAAEVREAHVLEQIKKSSHAVARKAMEDLVRLIISPGRIAWALGLQRWGDDDDEQELFDKLPRLQLEQLAMLFHYNHVEHGASLTRLTDWDPRSYLYEHRAARLAALKDVYGYELSDPEKEALAYWSAPEPEEAEDAGGDDDADAT